jgi:hypothetical protein
VRDEAKVILPVVQLVAVAVVDAQPHRCIGNESMHQNGSSDAVHAYARYRISVRVKVPAMFDDAFGVGGVNERPCSRLTITPPQRDSDNVARATTAVDIFPLTILTLS